jgi:heparosan-N-sulfate-glucuronate 5-epimerase
MQICERVLGKYWISFVPSKVPHRGPVNDGIPLVLVRPNGRVRPGRGARPTYDPIAIMQYALGNYGLALEGDAVAQDAFIRCVRWIQDNAVEEREGRFLVWPFNRPLRMPPVRPPWISGMAQGEGLSVLAREFLRTRSDRTADIARRAANSFLYTVSSGGIITPTGNNRVFIEEYAVLPSTHILNGCLTGLFGLWEHLRVFPDSQLQTIFEAGIDGVENWLPHFDMGFWSRYSLGIRCNIAPLHYHNTHIEQLRYFGRTLGRPAFSDRADRWEAYTRLPLNRRLHRCASFLSENGLRAATVLSLHRLKYRHKNLISISETFNRI